jgi:hypothetical protein
MPRGGPASQPVLLGAAAQSTDRGCDGVLEIADWTPAAIIRI